MSVPNQLFSNNATSLLAAPISQIATSLTVMTGYGVLFPQPVDPGDYFLVTLENQTGTEREILKVTGRTGDTFTGIQRAQEGTTALMWTAMIGDDTLVDHRVTAETMRQALLQPAEISTVHAFNVTASTTIDTAPTGATVAKWFIRCVQVSTPANVYATEVYALTDDAVSAVDFTKYATLKLGDSIPGLTVVVGTDAGALILTVTSSAAVDVQARRVSVIL